MYQTNEIKVVLVLFHLDFTYQRFNKYVLAKIWCANQILIFFTFLMKMLCIRTPAFGFNSFVEAWNGKST